MVDFGKMRTDAAWGRIAKLIGMLGSEHDGERLNAARLLQASLEKNELSFGDLAQRVERGGSGVYTRTIVQEKRTKPNPAAEIAHKVMERARTRLNFNERAFLLSIIRKAELTDGDYDLNQWQADWLDTIDKRYVDRGMPMQRAKRTGPVPDDILNDIGMGKKSGRYRGERVMPDASEDSTTPSDKPLDDDWLDSLGLGTVQGSYVQPPIDRHKDVRDRFEGLDIDNDPLT